MARQCRARLPLLLSLLLLVLVGVMWLGGGKDQQRRYRVRQDGWYWDEAEATTSHTASSSASSTAAPSAAPTTALGSQGPGHRHFKPHIGSRPGRLPGMGRWGEPPANPAAAVAKPRVNLSSAQVAALANPLAPRAPLCPEYATIISNSNSRGDDYNSTNHDRNKTNSNRSDVETINRDGWLPTNVNRSTLTYACGLFRDEQGFLAEFVAFYKVLGVAHVMLFDHYSSDGGVDEVKAWIDEGFLTIRNATELEDGGGGGSGGGGEQGGGGGGVASYWRVIAMKRKAERLCMEWGLAHGYQYHLSVDLDEYLFPETVGRSLPESIDEWFTSHPSKGVMIVPKTNFNPSPHLLEPIDLLTIEAYLLKYPEAGGINFHMTVQPKVVYRLQPRSGENATLYSPFLLNCCAFHGCEIPRRRPGGGGDAFDCLSAARELGETFNYDSYSRMFAKYSDRASLRMNHYARSLEKHAMKGKTWMTASQSSNQYDLMSYFHRTFGWTYDDSTLRFACSVREEIHRAWAGRPFLRPGGSWFRNPEFGKAIDSPEKRGRGNGRAVVRTPYNPYHYETMRKQHLDTISLSSQSTRRT